MPKQWVLFCGFLTIAAGAQEGPTEKSIERQIQSVDKQRAAAERQAQAVRAQYPSHWNRNPAPLAAAPPQIDCPPVAAADVKPIIDREAARHKLDAKLVQAVVETESAYSPCAVSPVGALGLMQLMPDTAQSLGVQDAFDPEQNISAGTQFLRQMLDRYGGDVAKALAAYNAGPGRVDAANGIPTILETQNYVRKIMGKITPPAPVAQ